MITTGTRVQHSKTGKVGTVTFTGASDSQGRFNIRVSWDGARASVVFSESVTVIGA